MTLRLRKHVSVVETDDGTVLLDETSGRYWQLNQSGALILRTLQENGSPEAAAQALSDDYDVEPARALSDVQALLESLRSARLVHL